MPAISAAVVIKGGNVMVTVLTAFTPGRLCKGEFVSGGLAERVALRLF